MGDIVPLVIQTGRLNVNTTIRVLGIAYDIGDDGQEDVDLDRRPSRRHPGVPARPSRSTTSTP